MFWDAKRPYHYFRWIDDRVLFGGDDRPVPRTASARGKALRQGAATLKRVLSAYYPDVASVRVSHAWEGLFATTPDGLPYIGPHRRYPRHLFALGYGGNGMTFGFLAGEILVRFSLGTASADDALFAFGRFRR